MHRLRAPRPVVAALLLATVAATLGIAPSPVRGVSAPPCTVDDVLTRYRKIDDWYRSVLDTELRLKASYAPADLVAVSKAGVDGDGKIRKIALKDFTAMAKAAKAAGAPFAVQSAYRSYRTQVETFAGWVAADGYDAALISSARPGHSEHQLGTTVDLKTRGGAAALEPGRLGPDEGGVVARQARLEVRLDPELPGGAEPAAHLLQVRAVALPVRRATHRGAGPRLRAVAPRVAVAQGRDVRVDGPGTRSDAHADPRADADPDADRHRRAHGQPGSHRHARGVADRLARALRDAGDDDDRADARADARSRRPSRRPSPRRKRRPSPPPTHPPPRPATDRAGQGRRDRYSSPPSPRTKLTSPTTRRTSRTRSPMCTPS